MPLSPNNQPRPNQLPPKGKGSVVALSFLTVFLILGVVALLNRQAIWDRYRLLGYQAPAPIAAFADQDTMTNYARKIFYVNRPEVDSAQTFHSSCPNNGGEQTIVLGCYHGNQNGIYLLSVSEPLLNGVQQVTAAHEMLHAAYDRLSPTERKQVDAWLLDYYNNGLQDARIKKTLDAYKKTEPNDVVNEMHSIFATEVAVLPNNLEQYYKRYFGNRSVVIAYENAYQAAFSTRRDTIAKDDAILASLKSQIESAQSTLASQLDAINSQRQQLNALQNKGDIAAYNANVPAFNRLVDGYNSQLRTIKNLIAQYNQLVTERNAIAVEEDQLVKELTSSSQSIAK